MSRGSCCLRVFVVLMHSFSTLQFIVRNRTCQKVFDIVVQRRDTTSFTQIFDIIISYFLNLESLESSILGDKKQQESQCHKFHRTIARVSWLLASKPFHKMCPHRTVPRTLDLINIYIYIYIFFNQTYLLERVILRQHCGCLSSILLCFSKSGRCYREKILVIYFLSSPRQILR